jgi:hypothetical protein
MVDGSFFQLCANNCLVEAQKLYESGVDVDWKNPDGETALMRAAMSGHMDVVEWLIEVDAPLETKDSHGYTALTHAAIWGRIPVMKVLIAAGADGQVQEQNTSDTPRKKKVFPILIPVLLFAAACFIFLYLSFFSKSESNMVLVEGGVFLMGNTNGYHSDEKPEHEVSVSSFYMGKYEVTQKEWFEILTIPELLDKVGPYQGIFGAVLCIWGLWGVIFAVLTQGWLATWPLWWATRLAGNAVCFLGGAILGWGLIQQKLLAKASIEVQHCTSSYQIFAMLLFFEKFYKVL